MIDSLNVAGWRATGHETMAHVEAARGRWGAAKRDIAAFQRLLPDGGMVTLGMLTLTPAAPEYGAEARDVRERLTAWIPGTAGDTVRRLYLLGMFAARQGEHEGALAYARALDAYTPRSAGADSSTLGPEARDRALSVRAESAWRRGALVEALRHLEASRPERWWALYTNANILETWAYERFMRAEILTQIGRHDDARHWYAALRLNERELVFDAIAQLRLGQAASRRGDSAQAALHYEAVITRWGNADADVPAYHMEARAALARISR